jgi:hypothetical protein
LLSICEAVREGNREKAIGGAEGERRRGEEGEERGRRGKEGEEEGGEGRRKGGEGEEGGERKGEGTRGRRRKESYTKGRVFTKSCSFSFSNCDRLFPSL